MKYLAFSWLLGGQGLRKGRHDKRRQKGRAKQQSLRFELEGLENRVMLSTAPQIIAVAPVSGSSSTAPLPPMSVTFSADMKLADVQNVNNYLLFNSEGQPLSIDTAVYTNTALGTFSPNGTGPFVVTLTYNQASPLPADVYSLFVRGDQIHDTTNVLLAQSGQVAVVNQRQGNVSVVGVNNPPTFDGQLEAGTNYFSNGFNPSSVLLVDDGLLRGGFSPSGINDLLVGTFQSVDIYQGRPGGGYSPVPVASLPLTGGLDARSIAVGQFDNLSPNRRGLDIAVAEFNNINGVGSGNVDIFLSTSTTNLTFGPAVTVAAGQNPVAIIAADIDGNNRIDLAVAGANQSNNAFNVIILPGDGQGGFAGAATTIDTTAGAQLTGLVSFGQFNPQQTNRPNLAVSSLNGTIVLQNRSTVNTPAFNIFALAGGTSAQGVAAGDLDGDGITDIASLGTGGVLQAWTANLGAPNTWASIPGLPTVGPSTRGAIAIARLQPGGLNDIVVSNGSSAYTVQTIAQSAPGVFAPPVTFATDPDPVALVVGDTNQDGLVDVVTANRIFGTMSVFRGIGDGGLWAARDYPLGGFNSNAQGVATGDVNGDGLADIIVPKTGSGQVGVFLATGVDNHGQLTYGPATNYTLGFGGAPVSVALGDFDGRNLVDIAVVNRATNRVSILVNNGDGTFVLLPGSVPVGDTPTQVVLADFNSDNKLDMAVGHYNSTNPTKIPGVTVAFGRGNGTFNAPFEIAATVKAQTLAVVDFNNDKFADLAVVDSQNPGATLTVLANDGLGNFTPHATYNVSSTPSSIAVADLNRDGYQDLVVGSLTTATTANLSVLLNSGGTGYNPAIGVPVFSGAAVQSVAVTNVNVDAFPDLVVTLATPDFSDNNIYSLLGNGDGTYQTAQPYIAGGIANFSVGPSYVSVLSDSLILATTFTENGTIDAANLIRNGSFDTPDLNGVSGSLMGWKTFDQDNSHGAWRVQTPDVTTGTSTSPLSLVSVPAPPSGNFAAMLDQADVPLPGFPSGYSSLFGFGGQTFGFYNQPYDGMHILYQDISIPANTLRLTLSFSLAWNSQATFTDTSQNRNLDYSTAKANQQIRVDIMDPTAPLTDVGAGVLQSLFITSPNSVLVQPYTPFTFDLAALANRPTLRLRVAAVNNAKADPSLSNNCKLVVGVDGVALNAIFNDTTAPAITGLKLRNPGFGASGNFAGFTSDPTFIGQLVDNGTNNNIKYLQFSTTDPVTNLPIVSKLSTWDATGHFTFTLPVTVPGFYNVNVLAVDRAGNLFQQPVSFTLDGPSLTNWQARGPGQILTTGVAYPTVSGRVTAVVVDPRDSSGNTFYIGAANGGVWKTNDGGQDYTPVTDYIKDAANNPIATPIGGLAISKSNPDILYAGLGVADNSPDSRPGSGILKTSDGGLTWTLLGAGIFAGARISKMAVDPNDPNIAYVAVASGGSGPGLYRTMDGGLTWTNTTNPANMFLAAPRGQPSPGPLNGAVGSVTDVVLDAFDSENVYIGIGNVGLTPLSSAGGLWMSPNRGGTWRQIAIGQASYDAAGTNDLPSGTTVGRVTVGIGNGRVGDSNYLYVLMASASPTPPRLPPNSTATGNSYTAPGGLYLSRDAGLDWTHVQLNEGVELSGPTLTYFPIDLFANDGAYAGALAVDPTDPFIIYVGGTDHNNNNGSTTGPPFHFFHSFLRVDTRDVVDHFAEDWYRVLWPNNGDSFLTQTYAEATGGNSPAQPGGGTFPKSIDKGSTAYSKVGALWVDLVHNTSNPFASFFFTSSVEQLPGTIQALTFDPQGQLLVGTTGGIFRGVSFGFVNNDAVDTQLDWSGTRRSQIPALETGMVFTSLNGNLQIADLHSVAIDPQNANGFYTAQSSTGTAKTTGGLTWQSMQLFSTNVIQTNLVQLPVIDGGIVRVAPPPPGSPAGTPSVVYATWEYVDRQNGIGVSISTDGGLTWSSPNTGLNFNDSSNIIPALVINPNKDTDNGIPRDELLYGTNHVYESDTSGITWDLVSNAFNPATDGNITALAFGPSGHDVFYVGTDQGQVFIDVNNGSNNFPNRTAGLPGVATSPVNGIKVYPGDPVNDTSLTVGGNVLLRQNIAFVMLGGTAQTTAGHVWLTLDAGLTWQNVTGNLPDVPAYSMAIDDRSLPNAPLGTLYVGTEVGVYFSLDFGTSWQRLGQGLPNVAVVDLDFNKQLNVLAAGTRGRGVFTISTDHFGPFVNSITPLLSSNGNALLGMTITFDEPVDPATVNLSQINSLTGPNGAITALNFIDVTPTPFGEVNPHNIFQITFASPQTALGLYTVSLGPNIIDFTANKMDQNQNKVNGEVPGDILTAAFFFQPFANTPPVINGSSVTFPAIKENSTPNPGTDLASFVASFPANVPAFRISDPDDPAYGPAKAPRGFAVTAVDNTNGSWEFSTDGGNSWTPFGTPSPTSARLLEATPLDRIRFLPRNDFNGTATFTFRAWDLTSGLSLTGADGGTADVTVVSPTSAFSSSSATATITVLFVNDPPSFTAVNPPTVNEGAGAQTVVGWAGGFNPGPGASESGQTLVRYIVSNISNPAMFAVPPAVANNGTLTYTLANFMFGQVNFDVQVQDNGGTANGGNDTSAAQTFTLTVNLINDRPTFTAVNPPTVNEDAGAQSVVGWVTSFNPGPAEGNQAVLRYIVTNVTNPSLFAALPNVTTSGTLTYILRSDVSGTSNFTVQVQDNGGTANGGIDTSFAQVFTLTVNSVNDQPSFTALNPPAVNENAGAKTVTGWVTTFNPGPNEGSQQVVQYTVSNISNPAMFTVLPSVANNGTLTYTLADHVSGPVTFKVQVQDNGGTANGGIDTSVAQTFTLVVNFVNDRPAFTANDPPTVNENTGTHTIVGWVTSFDPGPGANEAGQTVLRYIVSNISNPGLFASLPAVTANGTLSYTLKSDVSGTTTFSVQVQDNGGTAFGGIDTSQVQVFSLTVNLVNDPPTFTAANPPTINEDAGAQTVVGWVTSFNPGPGIIEASQSVLQYIVEDISDPSMFAVLPSVGNDGTLYYTPANNVFGSVTFEVLAQDDGGTANGGNDTSTDVEFTLTIRPVNDRPSFVAANPPAVTENSGPHTVAGWATGFSAGPANESSQGIQRYIVSNISNPAMFTVLPAVANNGDLTYTLANSVSGPVSFNVQVQDTGGVANGGNDTSTAQTFTLTVNLVNDQPSFTAANPPAVNENASAQAVVGWVTGFNPGPGANEASQSVLRYIVTNISNPALFAAPPVVATNGTLTYTPALHASGTSTFAVAVQDTGGTAFGGIDTSVAQIFTITVNFVNDQPSFSANNPPAVNENAGFQVVFGWVTGFNPGPGANEAGQTVLRYLVTNVSNPAMFTTPPAVASDGTLTYTLADHVSGPVSFAVAVQDNGGTAFGGIDTSATQTFTLNINFVNDQPTFTGSDVTVNEDSGPATLANWAVFNPGPGANEAGQSVLRYVVTNVSNPALFSVLPVVANNGTLTFTPAGDMSGASTFTVSVQDNGGTAFGGIDTSLPKIFTIGVNFVNDQPAFTAANPPAVNENGGARTVVGWVTSFNPGPGANEAGQSVLRYLVTNVSNPALFTALPTVANNGTLTYTLANNVSGTVNFTVQVQDDGGTANGGIDTSVAQTFSLTVNLVNDQPSFVASNVTTDENSGPVTIANWATFVPGPGANEAGQSVLHYNVSNISNPGLFAAAPSVANNGTLSFTSATDISGSSTFAVSVQDSGGTSFGGVDTSVVQVFTITVNFVNKRPSFTAANPPTVNEGTGNHTITGWVSNFNPGSLTDPDEVGQSALVYTVTDVTNPALFTAAGQPAVDSAGNLTYTLAPNQSGTTAFTVTVQDNGGTAHGGVDTSLPQTFNLTVNFVNDRPTFTAANPPAVNEDSGAHTVTGWVTSFNPGPGAIEAGQGVLRYIVSNISNPAMFTVAPAVANSGTLTYTLANDVSGPVTFNVQVQDNGGTANGGIDTSLAQTFTLNVNLVNDRPSFSAANPPAVNEDASPQAVTGWVTSFNPGPGANEAGQSVLRYVVGNISNPALFAVPPAVTNNGTLTYALASDVFGTVNFDVQVQDNGGTANGGIDTSTAQTFTLNVNSVNDAPSFSTSGLPAVNEDSGAQTVANWVTSFSPGPGNEAGQTVVRYLVGNISNPALFAVLPAVAINGTLTYTLASDVSGQVTFDVQVQDNGGTANGGIDTSAAQHVTLNVNPVNDQPSFSAANPPAINEDSGSQTVAGWVAAFNPGPGEPGQAVLRYIVGNVSNPALFAVLPAVASNGTLTYTLARDVSGSSSFSVQVQDNGGINNGGNDTSGAQTFTLTVNPVNDQPTFTAANPPSVFVNAGAQSVSGWASNFNPGPNEAGQTVLRYLVTNVSNPALFAVAPAVNANGTLTYTLANNISGTSNFDVQVQDSGGTANGGIDTSTAKTVTLQVLAPPPSLSDQEMSYTQSKLTINLTPGATYQIRQAGTQAWYLFRSLGLSPSTSFFQNSGGANEKWFLGNQTQFGSPWYFIKPNGQIFAWDKTPGRATGILMGTVEPVYWQNPGMIWNISSPDTYAYVIQQGLGLTFTGNLYQNYNGLQERWLQGTGGAWYYITPDGKLYTGSGAFQATLDPIYYNQPSRLYNAQANQISAVLQSGATPALVVTPLNQFVGNWVIEVTTTFGTNSRVDRFTVAVNNHAPVLGQIGTQTLSNPVPGPNTKTVNVNVSDADGDTVSLTATGGHLGYVLANLYSLRFAGSYYNNSVGLNEKWVAGKVNASNNPWYYILPNGQFYAWSGAGPVGTLLATLDPIYYAYPDMLYSTSANDLAFVTKQRLGLHVNSAGLYQDYGGVGTRWLQDSAGAWYFMNTSGQFFKWNGTANLASGTLLATFDPVYYTNIATRLAAAQSNQFTVQTAGSNVMISPLATPSNFIGDIWVLVSVTDDATNPLNRRFSFTYFKLQVTG